MGIQLIFVVLLPVILGLIALGILFYVRGSAVSIIRPIILILWMSLLCSGLGYLATKIESLSNRFLMVFLGAILLGVVYLVVAPLTLNWWKRLRLLDLFLTSLMLLLFGIGGFALLYTLLSVSEDLPYLLVALAAFLLPSIYVATYDNWMQIPPIKYKSWIFPIHSEIPRLHPIEPMRITMNFTPLPTGRKGPFEGYEVEFPTNVSVGELFHYFISFHNKHREYRKKPIQYLNGKMPLQWVLFKNTSNRKKLYLDMDKTLIENQIVPNDHIYAYSTE